MCCSGPFARHSCLVLLLALFAAPSSNAGLNTTAISRPRCKNVTLSPNEFSVSSDERVVFLPALNASLPAFALSADGSRATVCVPFSAAFMTCKRWMLNRDEFELRRDDLELRVPVFDRVYAAGDFSLRDVGGRQQQQAVVCIENPAQSADDDGLTLALGVTWIVSAVSLVAAGFLCLALPVPTTYRAVLPFYMVNLFAAYALLSARCFGPVPGTTMCLVYGVLLQFSFLAAFFWLNAIAFHVWRCVARVQRGQAPDLNGCLLAAYVAYGWGSALVICVVTFLVEAGELFPNVGWLQPAFRTNCWFGPRAATLVFFYGPMAAILAANVGFFVLTVLNVRSASKFVSSLKPEANNSKVVGTALHLIVIMGLCWIMEALSWAIGGDRRYWYFTDLLNGLQGFFVLVVVIADSRVYGRIRSCCGSDDVEDVANVTDVSAISGDVKPKMIK